MLRGPYRPMGGANRWICGEMSHHGRQGRGEWMPAEQRPLTRAEQRQQGAEGGLAPVVLALALSAVLGTVLGWLLLSRDRGAQPAAPGPERGLTGQASSSSSSQQRERLLSRLRALQVDRSWFLRLVDSTLLQRHPDRAGRLPSEAPEDAALRRVWADLAQDWLARVERLSPALRARLGSLGDSDWRGSSRRLMDQGIHPSVLTRLVGAAARDLLPGEPAAERPVEPFRQLWIAAAMRTLDDLRVETVQTRSGELVNRSLRVPARGAQLLTLSVPPQHNLVLGINGTPLMQMTLFRSDGTLLDKRGPLRVISLGPVNGSPLQLLVTNDGVASGLITLSCRAESAAGTGN